MDLHTPPPPGTEPRTRVHVSDIGPDNRPLRGSRTMTIYGGNVDSVFALIEAAVLRGPTMPQAEPGDRGSL